MNQIKDGAIDIETVKVIFPVNDEGATAIP
jgi:hypothetical protein